MSVIGTARELYQVGREEFQDASLYQRAMLGATALTLAFEWGTGNEAVIGISAGRVLQETHSILLTTATAGGASLLEQAVFGLSAVASIHNFPKLMGAVRTKLFERGQKLEAIDDASSDTRSTESSQIVTDDIPEHTRQELSFSGMLEEHLGKIVEPEISEPPTLSKRRQKFAQVGGRFLTAITFGTSIVAMKNNAIDELSVTENIRNIFKDAGYIGAGVAVLGAIAAGATNGGRAIGLQTEANIFIDVLTNPGTYIGLFSLRALLSFRKKRRMSVQSTQNDYEAELLDNSEA
jgi:hypothetical protein